MPQRKPRRGTRRLLIGGAICAFVVGFGITLSPWFPGARNALAPTATSGLHPGQPVGQSTVGRLTPPPTGPAPRSTMPAAVGRGEDIVAAAKNDLGLKPDQRKTIEDFAAEHAQDRVNQANFAIAVGAAVPEKIPLRDMPISLADALSAYLGDQYLLLPKRFVIVEKETRRIVAIIPVPA
jgi:hypothetical protein